MISKFQTALKCLNGPVGSVLFHIAVLVLAVCLIKPVEVKPTVSTDGDPVAATSFNAVPATPDMAGGNEASDEPTWDLHEYTTSPDPNKILSPSGEPDFTGTGEGPAEVSFTRFRETRLISVAA